VIDGSFIVCKYGVKSVGLFVTNKPSFSVIFTQINCKPVQLTSYLPYFPAHKTHFFSRKMWPKFDLRLMRRG